CETSVVVDRAPFRRPVARTEALELHERIRSAVHRAGGPIADERRVADGGGAAAGGPCLVPEGPADYQRVVVEKDIAVQVNGGADLVQDAAAALLRRIHCALGAAVGDGQAVDGHGRARADVEDPAGVVAADGYQKGARPLDSHVAGEVQLTG